MAENSSKKIIICPDSFKGTMDSVEAAETIAEAIRDALPTAEVYLLPIADGGEGTLECFRRSHAGSMVCVQTRNSNFKAVNAEYFLTPDSAVIESAKVIGLFRTEFKNPMRTTSYGVGSLIADALKHTNKIVLTLGGSSTNDGGCGIAAALGARFLNAEGRAFIPTGATLKEIADIDISAMPSFDLTCMCDVKNPMYGKNGAAYVFAPQKGADYIMVKELDHGLRHLAEVIKKSLGADVGEIEGGGAAGGIAAGMVAFAGAKLMSGIEIILESVCFDGLLDNAKLVITGEGRLDSQSVQGKVIDGITRHAKAKNVPVIAICGQIEMGFDLKNSGLALAIASGRSDEKLDKNHDYKKDLYDTAFNLFSSLKQ